MHSMQLVTAQSTVLCEYIYGDNKLLLLRDKQLSLLTVFTAIPTAINIVEKLLQSNFLMCF